MSGLCFFIGHRETPYSIRKELHRKAEQIILDYEINQFIVGQYGAFDHMAASVVKELKEQYSDISLLLLLPYHPSERPVETPAGFDGTFYPEGQEFAPKRLAIVKANQAVVNECDILIAYAKHPGNARKLVEYAQRKGIRVINLAEENF